MKFKETAKCSSLFWRSAFAVFLFCELEGLQGMVAVPALFSFLSISNILFGLKEYWNWGTMK